MVSIESKQTIYVNSKNRSSGTPSEFTITLDIDKNIAFDKISVIDAVIPRSFYNIGSRNDTFVVSENGNERTITIPRANYSRKSLKNVVQTLLNTNPEPGYSYVVSKDASSVGDSGKYTFTVTTANPQPSFIFSSTSPLAELGFTVGTHAFVGNVLVSEKVVNLLEKNRLVLRSNICQNNTNSTLQNIVASSGSSFDYIVFQNPTPVENHRDFIRNSSNSYTFQLFDENLNPLELDLDFSFTLMLYKETRILRILKEYLQLRTLLLE